MSYHAECYACKRNCLSEQSLTCQNCGDFTFCPDCAIESLYRLRSDLKQYCASCFIDMATRIEASQAFSLEDAIVDVFH